MITFSDALRQLDEYEHSLPTDDSQVAQVQQNIDEVNSEIGHRVKIRYRRTSYVCKKIPIRRSKSNLLR
jgi:hypothetical protein